MRGEIDVDVEVAFSIRYPLSYVSIFVLHVVFN
jgi:hypothetical protein